MDTIQHHLMYCSKTLLFWDMFFNWWNSLEVLPVTSYSIIDILFGYPNCHKKINILNYIIIIAKYHIYKNKKNNSEPFFPQMLIDLKNQLFIDESISIKNNSHSKFLNDYDFVYNAI